MQPLWQEIFRRERERETGREREEGEREREREKNMEKKNINAVAFILHSVISKCSLFPVLCLLTQIKHFPDTLLG